MKTLFMALVVAGMAGIVQAQDAAPAAPAAASEKLVFGFDDDAWKTAKFSSENGKMTLVEENATEGKKALALEFDQTGKTERERPTIRINKAEAFNGAKQVLVDVTFTGEVARNTSIRFTLRDGAKGKAETSEGLTAGKTTLELDLAPVDASRLSDMKISLDNCKSGKGKLVFDNFRMKK